MTWETHTSEGFYWLGFLYADGYFHQRREGSSKASCVVLQLKGEDVDHVRSFTKFIGSERPVYELDNNGFPAVRVDIYKGADDLIDNLREVYGLTLRPKHLLFDEIPEQFRWDFLRGFLDGDGSVIWKDRTVKALQWFGEEEMIRAIKSYINQLVPPLVVKRIKADPTKLKNGYVFRVEGKRAAVLHTLLCKETDFCLERKWKKEAA